jgi:hypothetical protein
MIASTASAVLPVARSPMMSSRWPRPSANRLSTTSTPVSTGCETRSRAMIGAPGARPGGLRPPRSAGRRRAGGRADRRPGRGAPRRRARAAPRRCRSPGRRLRPAVPPSSITASSASRSSAWTKPCGPPSNRRSAPSAASGRPETRAMPSATRVTRPTASASGSSSVAASRPRVLSSQSGGKRPFDAAFSHGRAPPP